MKKIYIVLIVSIILLLIAISLFLFLPEKDQLYKCKMDAWKSCGLDFYKNESLMCYYINGTNDTNQRWGDCQIVSKETSDCWRINRTLCEEKYDPRVNKSLIENGTN